MTFTAEAPRTGYGATAKTLHWLVVLLLIAQFTFAWTMPDIGRDTPVTTLISLHFTFGVTILAVAVVRLVVRLNQGEPPRAEVLPAWQNGLAHAVHWLLYILLLVIPVLGWINASWRGMPVALFGQFEMPNLIATRAAGWQWTGGLHMLLSTIVLQALVALHIVGALYHYQVRKDGVLQRMLPGL